MTWGEVWSYLVLFGLAAAPWLEVFLVIPLGIAWGLHPTGVAVVGFVGNWIPILLIVYFYSQITLWLRKRRARKLGIDWEEAEAIDSKKTGKGRSIWSRYGMPGLALLAPALIGTDITALLALLFGIERQRVLVWMTVSLLLWTVLLAVGFYYGWGFVQTLHKG
jgi:uncharacterized membrane protein